MWLRLELKSLARAQPEVVAYRRSDFFSMDGL
jgi:hypothetical protein